MVFDWDLFGVGVDAGQTTIRPRHMYGQWGVFGAGQTESPFMDLDVFPNILEYWGPNGMLFFRNVQVFYEPLNEPTADASSSRSSGRVRAATPASAPTASSCRPSSWLAFRSPDLSATYRYAGKWGYVQDRRASCAGSRLGRRSHDRHVRSDGGVTGWGVSLSVGHKSSKNV